MTKSLPKSLCGKLALVISLMAASAVSINAQSFSDGTLNYEIGPDGTAFVAGLADSEVVDLVIPAEVTYDNVTYPVTQVMEYSVVVCDFTSLTLGENITTLQEGAFKMNSSLEKVVMNDKLKYIGDEAFSYCSALSEIEWGKGIESIGYLSFYKCGLSGELPFGKDLKDFNATAFRSNFGINSVSVDPENPYFCSEEGVMFSKAKDELVFYPYSREGESYDIPAGVKKIGSNAMRNNQNLITINLNEGLEYIDSQAFASDKIESLTIPASLKGFGGGVLLYCKSLTKVEVAAGNENFSMSDIFLLMKNDAGENTAVWVSADMPVRLTIPSDVNHIDDYLFYYSALKTCHIPSSVKTLGYASFYGSTDLKMVTVDAGLEKVGEMCFQDCSSLTKFEFPETLKVIDFQAFCDAGLLKANLPDGVETVGQSAFFCNDKMEEARIPASVKEWVGSTFYGCTSLTKCEISEGIQIIPEQAFNYCASLSEVTIPSTVTEIGQAAFYSNPFTSMELPKGLKRIGEMSFYGTSLESIVIPDEVEIIDKFAFAWCPYLKTATVGKSVKVLSERVFHVMPSLEEVILPEGLEELGEYAISFADEMKSISLPSTLTTFGDGALVGNPFEEITANMVTPPAVPETLFTTSSNDIYGDCELRVPEGSVEAYKQAEVWRNFYSIVGDPSVGVEDIDAAEPEIVDVYTIDGIRLSEPAKGQLNIVRLSDGTVKKVFVK